MIHGGLPTCEKMDRLVSAEKSNNNKYNTESTFFSKKYEKVTNNGDCPCCGKEKETIRHLFGECTNPDIQHMRSTIYSSIQSKLRDRYGNDTAPAPVFYYNNKNQDSKPTEKWDYLLGTLGFIPLSVEKWLTSITDEEKKGTEKYAMCDIAQQIMQTNIEIWKYRCKLLYSADPQYFPT